MYFVRDISSMRYVALRQRVRNLYHIAIEWNEIISHLRKTKIYRTNEVSIFPQTLASKSYTSSYIAGQGLAPAEKTERASPFPTETIKKVVLPSNVKEAEIITIWDEETASLTNNELNGLKYGVFIKGKTQK